MLAFSAAILPCLHFSIRNVQISPCTRECAHARWLKALLCYHPNRDGLFGTERILVLLVALKVALLLDGMPVHRKFATQLRLLPIFTPGSSN
jgi:hypothetical protein